MIANIEIIMKFINKFNIYNDLKIYQSLYL
jgi:hypothetical protein